MNPCGGGGGGGSIVPRNIILEKPFLEKPFLNWPKGGRGPPGGGGGGCWPVADELEKCRAPGN